MILFPAIDLKDGQCVRLRQGEMAEATVFNTDPAAQARDFEHQGFEALHIVDLNGAFAGKPVNAAAVDRILDSLEALRYRAQPAGDPLDVRRRGDAQRSHGGPILFFRQFSRVPTQTSASCATSSGLRKPSGSPSAIHCANFSSVSGVFSAGLITIVFPAASAGPSFHAAMYSG